MMRIGKTVYTAITVFPITPKVFLLAKVFLFSKCTQKL